MAILEYGPPIPLETAKAVIEGAEAEAAANGWTVVIAVLNSGGHLVALHRMDHTQYASVEVAQAKAQTALNFKRPSKMFQDSISEGGSALRLLSMPGMCAVEGGILLLSGGRIIGSIGVSGVQSHQDSQVAEAGARAIKD